MGWFDNSLSVFGSLKEIILSAFLERMQRLHDMPKKAREIFWWPFTQHKLVPEETVTVIDSRCGENFSVHKVCGVTYGCSYTGHMLYCCNALSLLLGVTVETLFGSNYLTILAFCISFNFLA